MKLPTCITPWEPAIRVEFGIGLLVHDDAATHDIHLPGDGQPFDVDAVLAKLLIAEVIGEPDGVRPATANDWDAWKDGSVQ